MAPFTGRTSPACHSLIFSFRKSTPKNALPFFAFVLEKGRQHKVSQSMNAYNQEQLEAITAVAHCLKGWPPSEVDGLRARIETYLRFRKDVNGFLHRHFSALCARACYQSRQSACCGREGITTFFADIVINALMSEDDEMKKIIQILKQSDQGTKCVYLGEKGCLWQIKPIVCEMFLCERARKNIFGQNPDALQTWKRLRRREKRYTWPSRPVLFDELEAYFRKKGVRSSLMYFHNSPGLLRVKALARNKG